MCTMKRKAVEARCGATGSLVEMLGRFPDERSCERRLIEVRWPGGWRCPECGNERCSPVADRAREWQCTRCSSRFSVTAGTAMHATKVPLRKWFVAMWLEAHSKRGVSAAELALEIGVGERSASYLLRRLRGAMAGSECLQRALR